MPVLSLDPVCRETRSTLHAQTGFLDELRPSGITGGPVVGMPG